MAAKFKVINSQHQVGKLHSGGQCTQCKYHYITTKYLMHTLVMLVYLVGVVFLFYNPHILILQADTSPVAVAVVTTTRGNTENAYEPWMPLEGKEEANRGATIYISAICDKLA